jgi:hypothetical protein
MKTKCQVSGAKCQATEALNLTPDTSHLTLELK